MRGLTRAAQGDQSNRESTLEADTQTKTMHGSHKEAEARAAESGRREAEAARRGAKMRHHFADVLRLR